MKRICLFTFPLWFCCYAQTLNCTDPNNVCITPMINFGMLLYGCTTGTSSTLAFNVPPGQDWQFSVYSGDPSLQSFAILTEEAANNMPGGVCDGGPGVLFGPVAMDADSNPNPTVYTIPSSQIDAIRSAVLADGFVVIEASDCSSFIEFAGMTLTRNPAASSSDLAIQLVQSPDIVPRNAAFMIDFEVMNQGSNTVDSVMVSLPLPCNSTFVSGDVDGNSFTETNGQLTCSLGSLAMGNVLQGTLILTNAGLGHIGFDISISGIGCEATPEDNHLLGIFQVVPAEGDYCSCGFGILGDGFSTEIKGFFSSPSNKRGQNPFSTSFDRTGASGVEMCDIPLPFTVTDEDFKSYYVDDGAQARDGWFYVCGESVHQAIITITKEFLAGTYFDRSLVMKPMGLFAEELLVVHDLQIVSEPHWLEVLNQTSEISSYTLEIRAADGTVQSSQTVPVVPWAKQKVDLNTLLPAMGGPYIAWISGGPGVHLVYHHDLLKGVEIIQGSEPVLGPYILPDQSLGTFLYQRHPLDFVSTPLDLDLQSRALCTNSALATLTQTAPGQSQYRNAVTLPLSPPGMIDMNPAESPGTSGTQWEIDGIRIFIPPLQPQNGVSVHKPLVQDPSKVSVSFYVDEETVLQHALRDKNGKLILIRLDLLPPGATSFCDVFNPPGVDPANVDTAAWRPIIGNNPKLGTGFYASVIINDETNETYDVFPMLAPSTTILDRFYNMLASWQNGNPNCLGHPTHMLDLISFYTIGPPCP
ncbi:MAG: hypothetical protein H6510_16090 [Acidobacteria bacterium]|nr:hypothetical protein [Acidobacteriota bacterium]MCB9399334.1 hypothetical protein [Acidobacteriota bacterium]